MADLVVQWFRDVLSKEEIAAPDKDSLNGYSANPQVWEAMAALYDIHGKAGAGQKAKSVKLAWDTFTRTTVPEIDKALNRPRRLWHIDELAKRPPQQWLIPGKILQNGITTIFGASEAGKSFLAVDLAAQVALEKPVVYIAGEGQSGYYARYKAWLQYCGHKKSGKFYLYEDPVQMLSKPEVDAFIEDIRDIQPAMVVIDTLIKCFEGGDENQSKDINGFTSSCDRIRREFKCAVVIIHHFTKAANTERGSGALRNNSDVMIEVTNDDENIQVICSKTKDVAHWPTEVYRRLTIEIEQDSQKVSTCVLAPWNQVKLDPKKVNRNQTLVLEVLSSNTHGDCGAKTAEIAAIVMLSRNAVWRACDSLFARGFVSKPVKRSDPYFLTKSGWDLVRASGIGNKM